MAHEYTDGVYKINGDLTFERASEVFKAIDFSNIEENHIEVDLGGLEQSDSAALAVMLEWMRQAESRGKQIQFSKIPAQLEKLIEMADLQKIFEQTQ